MSDHPRPQLFPSGERVLLDIRPATPSIVLRPLFTVTAMVVLGILGAWTFDLLADRVGRGDPDLFARLNRYSGWAAVLGTSFAALRLLWEVLFWWSCRFVLTDQRAFRTFGVLSRSTADFPLRNLQHLTVLRTVRERLFGLGTVGIRTSGGAFPEMYWWMVARPHEVMATIRKAMDTIPPSADTALPDASSGSAIPLTSSPPHPLTSSSSRPLILGLAGGIGSGKSAVAAEFAALGALVIDSDKEAKAALDLPRVREELVKWWGPRVLTAEGRADRPAIASIIFSDPAERTRLEALVHPIVKATRAQLVERAAREGKHVVVVDAPLLYEAGVDKECDAVVFVDSPEPLRAARVQASRGWDRAELTRRENAQLPLEAKRRRADDVVVNDASREVLAGRVRDVLERIQRRDPRRRLGG